MAWDAGSIESSLDVDLSPFHHGLEKAKAEAREFADKRYTATIDINTRRSSDELTAVEQRLHSIESSIDRIGAKTGGGGGGFGGRGGLFSRLGGLPAPSGMALGIGAAIPAGIAAAAPFAGLAGGIAGGALSATVAGGLGLGAFGLGAKSNVSLITGDITKLDKLTAQYNAATTNKQRAAVLVKEQALWKSLDPAQRAAVKNVQHLDSAWASYKKKLEPQTFAVVADGAKIANTGLKYLLPTAQAVGDELDIMAKRAEHAFKAPFWHQFFGNFLPGEAARSVDALGTTLGRLGTGVANLVVQFAPLGHDLENALMGGSGSFEKWTQGSGPAKFVAWAEKEGPVAAKALEELGKGVTGLVKGLAPIGSIELKALTPVLNFIAKLGDEHPAVITALGGAFLTLGAGLKAVKLAGSIPGLGRVGGGGLGGGGGIVGRGTPIPVYVTNWQRSHGGPLPGGKTATTTAEEEAAGRGSKSIVVRAAEKIGLRGAARGAARLAPLLGPGVDVLTLATADSAPHTPLAKRGDMYSQLFNVLDPTGKKDFPHSFYPGNKLNVSAAVTSLATTGSAAQVAQLHDLAKTYPQIASALKGVQEAADNANDSLDREKSSVATLRAQFATLGPQVMQSLSALARTPAFLRDAEAAALNGGFIIGKNLKKGMVIGFQDTSGTVRFTNITQSPDGRNHVSTVTARRAAGGPVRAGELYQVNEAGVELFRPAVNGTIVPHNQAQQSSGPTRLSPHDISQLAREIGREIAARLPGVNQGALDRSLGIAVMSA